MPFDITPKSERSEGNGPNEHDLALIAGSAHGVEYTKKINELGEDGLCPGCFLIGFASALLAVHIKSLERDGKEINVDDYFSFIQEQTVDTLESLSAEKEGDTKSP